MSGYNSKLFPGTATSPQCLNFATSLNFRHAKSGFESQKVFQPKLCSLIEAYYLWRKGPQCDHVEVFNCEVNSLA